MRSLRCAIVVSKGGSVMDRALASDWFRSQIAFAVSDRECPALEKARARGVRAELLHDPDAQSFSDRLLGLLERERIDLGISFYTKRLGGSLVERYRDRLLNLHPSLLPSFGGMDGFGDTRRSGVRFGGTTIHFIDEGLDTGPVLLQSVFPMDPDGDAVRQRHTVFEHQCRSLLQAVRWFAEDRVSVEGRIVRVRDARYDGTEFAPSLDFDEAVRLRIAQPG